MLSRKKDLKDLKEKLNSEWEPEPIIGVDYLESDGNKVICMVDGKYLG